MPETPEHSHASVDFRRRRPRWLTGVLTTYWVGVFLLTHIPFPDTGEIFPHADKVVHAAIYTGLAFLLAAWYSLTDRRTALRMFLICVTYAAIDELTQIPIPTRSGDWRDWLADALGTTIGLSFWFWVRRRWQARVE